MKRTYYVAASAALMLGSLSPLFGAPKQKAMPANDTRTMFREIDSLSANISEQASRLHELAKADQDADLHLAGLTTLRDDVNRAGVDIQLIEANRDLLSSPELQTLDQITSLMADVAETAGKAIHTFNSDRHHLWATSYVGETARIEKEAAEVATLLRD